MLKLHHPRDLSVTPGLNHPRSTQRDVIAAVPAVTSLVCAAVLQRGASLETLRPIVRDREKWRVLENARFCPMLELRRPMICTHRGAIRYLHSRLGSLL